MSDLLGAFTKAGVSGCKTVVGIPDVTPPPSLPPPSFPVALSQHSLQSMQSMRSRDTLRPLSEYPRGACEAGIELMDEDEGEGDGNQTIFGAQCDDGAMSELWEASQSVDMSLCSIAGSVGD